MMFGQMFLGLLPAANELTIRLRSQKLCWNG